MLYTLICNSLETNLLFHFLHVATMSSCICSCKQALTPPDCDTGTKSDSCAQRGLVLKTKKKSLYGAQ